MDVSSEVAEELKWHSPSIGHVFFCISKENFFLEIFKVPHGILTPEPENETTVNLV